jgi:hypothetical protein
VSQAKRALLVQPVLQDKQVLRAILVLKVTLASVFRAKQALSDQLVLPVAQSALLVSKV